MAGQGVGREKTSLFSLDGSRIETKAYAEGANSPPFRKVREKDGAPGPVMDVFR